MRCCFNLWTSEVICRWIGYLKSVTLISIRSILHTLCLHSSSSPSSGTHSSWRMKPGVNYHTAEHPLDPLRSRWSACEEDRWRGSRSSRISLLKLCWGLPSETHWSISESKPSGTSSVNLSLSVTISCFHDWMHESNPSGTYQCFLSEDTEEVMKLLFILWRPAVIRLQIRGRQVETCWRRTPTEPGSELRNEEGGSVLSYQLVLLWQCTLDKQKALASCIDQRPRVSGVGLRLTLLLQRVTFWWNH